jgi:hypothetical protein
MEVKVAVAQLERPSFNETDIERVLSGALNPVDPNPEFVGRLSTRFRTPPATVMEHRTFWSAYIIMASGLFAGVFFLWLLRRIGVGG